MTCYLSVQNNDQIAGEPGVIYVFSGSGEVMCTQFGTFFGNLLNMQYELALTKSETNESDPKTNQPVGTDGSVNCEVASYCTAATTPPICNPSFVVQHPLIPGQKISCSYYYTTLWLAERPSSTAAWNCLPVLPEQNAVGTSNASLGVCTH